MRPLPALSGRDVIAALERAGFEVISQGVASLPAAPE
jgi:predicted RNA binding protein YcfA (HicA-like mRNA interferase family)